MSLAEQRLPNASLVAEADGKVVGFILGDASGYEYRRAGEHRMD